MRKRVFIFVVFLLSCIKIWGQSDTLSYESIISYFQSKSNMIEFYQLSGNTDKVTELTNERDSYFDALTDNYGKGLFYLHLSIEYSNNGNLLLAIENGNKSLEIFKKVLGTENPDYATSLNNLAKYYSDLGNYSEAIRLGTEATEIRKKVLGTEHPSYATSLGNLAKYYSDLGNYSEAIRLGTEVMEIRKKVLGTEHLDYALSLGNLANCYSDLGNYSEAIRLGTEAMGIRKKVLGTEHPVYAQSLGNLATYYSDLGNYSEAIRLETEATEIRKKVLGTEHPDYATSLINLATYYSDLGNYSEAIRLGTEAMGIRKKVLGTEHPDYATSLNNLALNHFDLGNYSEAIRLGTEATEIRKKVLGTEHPDYALSLNNLALYYSDLGNYPEAIRLGTEAMGITKKVLGTEHPDYATSFDNLANYYSHLGNYPEAIRLGTEATEIRKKVLGTEHPDYATSLGYLASYYSALGNYPEAYNLLKQTIQSSQAYILSLFSELSSGLQESLWNGNKANLFISDFPSIVYRHKTEESISELYDKTALFAKGFLLNINIGMRKLVLESGNPTLLAKYDALTVNRSIYEKQMEKPIKERFIDMDSLRSVIQQQEMELARESKVYGDFSNNLRINWKDVQQKLDDDDIAIEFLDFPLLGTDSTMYVALTLKKEYDYPHLTPLFEKNQLKTVPENIYYTRTTLYNLIWEPLKEELTGVKNVYFAPSGELHRIGIEYIPVTTTENICDIYNLHRLSSTRQLAFIQDEIQGGKSVLYGGLEYEIDTATTPVDTASTGKKRDYAFQPRANVDSLALRGSYNYLPGTKEEADMIASDLGKHAIPYSYYCGKDGTEESFKRLDGTKPRILHIATHGFYLTQRDAELERKTRQMPLDNRPSYHEDKPMTRSGLLLSGCGRALNHETIPEGKDDGILTAYEISKLDMRGLDLVVLSACQTGLGDITSGEGVFGLQRGFKNAGAKTIIMSLWKVSDIATQQLMTCFYKNYLDGKPKEQAFRMAQSELRKQNTSRQNKPDWAAFIMLDGIN